MTPRGAAWIAVLIKDFDAAKTRLRPAVAPASRRRLARVTAAVALRAAVSTAPTFAVCGSSDAAAYSDGLGVEAVLELSPAGQNPAAELAIDVAVRRGAGTVLLLSSDLPLVTSSALRRLFDAAAGDDALCVAAAASGRAGTNALLLRPPDGFTPQFGEASLPRFAAEARRTGRRFVVHRDSRLELDLDEPADLAAWQRRRLTA